MNNLETNFVEDKVFCGSFPKNPSFLGINFKVAGYSG